MLAATFGISVDFFSSGYLDVSVRRVCFTTLCIQVAMTLAGRVSPFGNPRIKAYSQLPAAYRSVSRPSSPLNAKASTKCPLRRLIAPYTKAESNLPIYGTQAIHMNAVKLHMLMFLRSNSLTLSNSCQIMANSFQYIL